MSLTVHLHKISTKWLEFEVDKELCKNDLQLATFWKRVLQG